MVILKGYIPPGVSEVKKSREGSEVYKLDFLFNGGGRLLSKNHKVIKIIDFTDSDELKWMNYKPPVVEEILKTHNIEEIIEICSKHKLCANIFPGSTSKQGWIQVGPSRYWDAYVSIKYAKEDN